MYLFSAVHFAKVHVGMTFLHDMKRFEKVGSTNAQELETSLNQSFSNETEVWVYHSTEPVEAPTTTEGENGGN